MDSSYRVRPLAAADIDQALPLTRLAGGQFSADEEPLARRALEIITADGNPGKELVVCLAAEHAATGDIVGIIHCGPPGDWAYPAMQRLPGDTVTQWIRGVGEIYALAVHPAHRRRGIGEELMNAVALQPAARKWRLLLWFYDDHNTEASAFYKDAEGIAPYGPGDSLLFLEPSGQRAYNFRTLAPGLRACLGSLDPDVHITRYGDGSTVVSGLFTGPAWYDGPKNTLTFEAPRPTRLSKGEQKRKMRARGR